MKVAIIGSGISGIAAAERLAKKCQVTLYEQADKVGGHADTQTINLDGKRLQVDTGFIVFNPENYPTFYGLLKKYGVDYQDSDMSFAVTNRITGLEYNASSLGQLFCQKRNLINPKFYRMIWDIFRFYRQAKDLLNLNSNSNSKISLGDYLAKHKYSQYFIDEHLIPMCSALWSGASTSIMQFPAQYLAAFMDNHKMLQAFNRPVWKTISGGSENYLNAILDKIEVSIKLNTKIVAVKRQHNGVVICSEESSQNHDKVSLDQEHFDKVIFACHSDQALKLLSQPTPVETEVLSNIQYQENIVQLHTDPQVLPKNRQAWASWNLLNDSGSADKCRVSYYMNLLQSIETKTPIIVSLNMQQRIDKSKVLKQLIYHHPIYNQKTIEAQQQKHRLQGMNHSYFCGAYWGWGFHEDGARSGVEAAEALLAERVLADAQQKDSGDNHEEQDDA